MHRFEELHRISVDAIVQQHPSVKTLQAFRLASRAALGKVLHHPHSAAAWQADFGPLRGAVHRTAPPAIAVLCRSSVVTPGAVPLGRVAPLSDLHRRKALEGRQKESRKGRTDRRRSVQCHYGAGQDSGSFSNVRRFFLPARSFFLGTTWICFLLRNILEADFNRARERNSLHFWETIKEAGNILGIWEIRFDLFVLLTRRNFSSRKIFVLFSVAFFFGSYEISFCLWCF